MVPFHSTDIIMVALFRFSYAVFSQKGIIIFFFLFVCSFFNKIVKPKYKTPFNKLPKIYIYYIFTIYGVQN